MAELNRRAAAMNAVRRISDIVERLQPGFADVYRLEHDLQSLSAHYTRFLQYHEHLVGLAKKDELDVHEQLIAEIEDIYNEACAALNHAIKPQLSASTGPRESDLRLEPLVIPKFDGTTQNWLAFKDNFEALVHNASYPEAYKLGKMRQVVSASDVPLIGSMYAGGYMEVWNALKERFDNWKRLAETRVARLLNLQATGEDTSRALLDIVDTVRESLRALSVMGLPVTQWDALVVPIIATKLPPGTRHEWNMSCSPTEIPRLEELLKFLEQRAQSLGSDAAIQVTKPDVTMHHQQVRLTPRIVRTHVTTPDPMKCGHCGGGHRIMRCSAFLAIRQEQRIAAARAAGLCFNYLKPGHTDGQCPSGECRQCQGKHNTLLCRNASHQPGHISVTAASSGSSPGPIASVTTYVAHAAPTVLLATARILTHGSTTTQCVARVLCDPGSQVSFVTEQFANSLSLRRNKYDVPVEGIGAQAYARTKGCVSVTLSSLQCNFEVTIEALVIPSITSDLPTVPIDMKRWLHLTNLELADTHFGTSGRIDVLIGADVWGRVVEANVMSGALGEPHAQRTRFGWVVFGPTSATLPTLAFSTQLREEGVDLEELVRQFWKLEEVPPIDVAEEECALVFSATHSQPLLDIGWKAGSSKLRSAVYQLPATSRCHNDATDGPTSQTTYSGFTPICCNRCGLLWSVYRTHRHQAVAHHSQDVFSDFCLIVTKAVHIEVVDDLSSPSFLDAFTRFVSRRGPCQYLYSDIGTAFVGANCLLQEDLTAWQSDNNQQALAHLGTRWNFIAPSAPHQGGLWEAAVKSAKRHLVRLVGAQVLWRSQLQTLAARIEACLNSRPLNPLYDDPHDKLALTPGDLLLGTPLVAVPEPDVSAIPTSQIKQWLWLRQLHQQF